MLSLKNIYLNCPKLLDSSRSLQNNETILLITMNAMKVL